MSEPTGTPPQDIDETTPPRPGAGAADEQHDDSPGDEVAPDSITDDQLPEDLRPSEDNPLAQPLDDEDALDDLDVHGGRPAEQWDDEQLED